MDTKNSNRILSIYFVDYYLFGILLYALVAFAWQKTGYFVTTIKYVAVPTIPHHFFMTVLVVLMPATLKQWRPKLLIPSAMLLLIGWFIQIKTIISLHSSILNTFSIKILILISLIISSWSSLIFFVGFDIAKFRDISKKLIKQYLIATVVFISCYIVISRHFLRSVHKITSSGSLFVDGGISYAEMTKLIDEKTFQLNIFLTILSIATALILLIPYKKVLNLQKEGTS